MRPPTVRAVTGKIRTEYTLVQIVAGCNVHGQQNIVPCAVVPKPNEHQDTTVKIVRTKVISVYVNETEWAKVKQKASAAGMRPGPYLRASGLGRQLTSSAYEELARETLAIGHVIMVASHNATDLAEILESRLRPILQRIKGHIR